MAKLLGGPLDGGEVKYKDPVIGLYFNADEPTRLARYDKQPNGDYKFIKTYDKSKLTPEGEK